ncbi:MAG TPA: helix-turn-helix domain-containing protein [Candidatus Paceibacterota bacterium]
MDEKTFLSLGMNHKEAKLYKALFKLKEAPPTLLGKLIKEKRTTAYSIARGLAEKGFIIENTTKRPQTFTIVQADDIERVLEDDRRQLALKEETLKKFATELSRATADDSYPVPEIRFVEEEKVEQFLTAQSQKWDQSMLQSDGTCWGFFDPSYLEAFPRVIDRYWKRAPQGISLKMFSDRSGMHLEEKIARKYPRRIIKIWDKARFDSAIWIMGEFVLMVNTRRHPFYLTEIHDATLAHDLREVFKNLWSLI